MSEDNQFIDLNKEATKREQEPGGGKGLLIGLIIAFLLLIAIICAAIFFYQRSGADFLGLFGDKSQNEQQVGNEGENPDGGNVAVCAPTNGPASPVVLATGTPVPTATLVPEAAKHCDNLQAVIDASGINAMNGVNAYVQENEGDEYLVIQAGDYVIKLRNDYVKYGAEPYGKVIVSYGGRSREYSWDYIIDEDNIKCFLPTVADFIGNGREQLAFAFFADENKEHNTLHVIAARDLSEYFVINPSKSFEDVIEIDDFWDAGFKRIARIIANDKAYYVSLPYMSEEEAKERYKLELDILTNYSIDVDKIVMRSLVKLSNAGYIGEIRSAVTFTSRDMFQASANTFYLYSSDDFNDKDHVGIVEPITLEEALKDRITVSGSNGEKLLAALNDNIPRTTLDPHKYAYDVETGLKGYYEDGVNKAMFGVDVSRWNENIDWKKAAAAGVDFAMIRAAYRGTAAEGIIYTDTYFEQNIKGSTQNGVKAGAYFFSQAITVEEAIEEANYIIEVLKPYKDKITFPVAFDTEKSDNARANDLSCEERTLIAKAFCDTIKAAGYTPMIYFSTNWSIMNLDLEALTDYDIWYAYYADDIYYPYEYKIWQYASDGSLPGFTGHVDMNVGFKDYSVK